MFNAYYICTVLLLRFFNGPPFAALRQFLLAQGRLAHFRLPVAIDDECQS